MKANNKIMFILAIALAFIGCTETEEPLSPNEEGDNDTPIEEKEIGSGEELPDTDCQKRELCRQVFHFRQTEYQR